jgi:hypothetical protein
MGTRRVAWRVSRKVGERSNRVGWLRFGYDQHDSKMQLPAIFGRSHWIAVGQVTYWMEPRMREPGWEGETGWETGIAQFQNGNV